MSEERKLSIEDIENSIDIFGLKFNLEFSEEYIDRLKRIDVKEIEKNENVFKQLKEMMNVVLDDKEAYDKINDEYKKQKGKALGIQGFLKVFEFIFEEYSKEFKNMRSNKMESPINREYKRYNQYHKNRNYRR